MIDGYWLARPSISNARATDIKSHALQSAVRRWLIVGEYHAACSNFVRLPSIPASCSVFTFLPRIP